MRFLTSISRASAFLAAAFLAFISAVPAFAQTTGTDPLAALVSGISFANLESDIVNVGIALAALYIVYQGVHWVLRMIRHG